MKTRCLIVDDEPLAIEVIETYLNNLSDIEIVGKCQNAVQAFEIIKKKAVDLIFLDIQMPQITGIDFVKTLLSPPKVIFTTAYRDYAIDGFDLNVVDYLLKPIPIDRFLKAMDKYYESIKPKFDTAVSLLQTEIKDDPYIFVKSDRKMIRILLDEIYFLESLKDYVTIYKKDKKIITKNQIGFFEQTLPHDKFLRIHRSYIVSVSKIEAYTPSSVEILNKNLPIGRNYKNEVMKKFNI
ncbi:MAG: LytTR family DNA-binding domain-containing protein [bacterium]